MIFTGRKSSPKGKKITAKTSLKCKAFAVIFIYWQRLKRAVAKVDGFRGNYITGDGAIFSNEIRTGCSLYATRVVGCNILGVIGVATFNASANDFLG